MNYDITHIFIDSALKIVGNDVDNFACFLNRVDEVSDKHNFQCIITASASKEQLPEEVLKYIK